jgi:hypothetical protein
MTKKTTLTGMVALTLCLLATGAGAAPTVTIAGPANGATISRSASPTLAVTGTAAFDAPQPSERTFYVRSTTSCPSTLNGNTGGLLNVIEGTESSHCGSHESATPVADETASPNVYTAENGVPFTLDGSRAISGVVSLDAFLGLWGAGLTVVDISVSGQQVGGSNQVLGSTTVSYTATPAQRYDTSWSIQPPAALDKKDFASLTLSLTVRGRNVLHGYTRPNSTKLTIPTYTSSFARAVEISLDNSAFTSSGVTLSSDQTTYAATLSTPVAGAHVIKVRSVQGSSKSSEASSSFTVTA